MFCCLSCGLRGRSHKRSRLTALSVDMPPRRRETVIESPVGILRPGVSTKLIAEMIIRPRDYQLSTLNAVRDRFARGLRRIVVQAPCGAGKTVMGGMMIQSAISKGWPVLWLADRVELVDQPSETFWHMGIENGIIMADRRRYSHRVQIASKDTLFERCIKTGKFDDLPWKGRASRMLIFVDEGHISGQETVHSIISQYPNAHVVCFTATPALPNGDGLGAYYDDMVVSVSYEQLVEEGYLVKLRLKAPEPPEDDIVKIVGDAYEHYEEWGRGRQTIMFAKDVEHSRALAAKFRGEGVRCEHIDGTMPKDVRARYLRQFKRREIDAISNCDVFSKGTDLPIAKCLILTCRVGSLVRYRQINRVQRPFVGYDDAIFVDMAGSCYDHGFPDEDIDWPFDPGENAEAWKELNARALEEKDREAYVCPHCHEAYRGSRPQCPHCKTVFNRRSASGSPEATVYTTITPGRLFDVSRREVATKKRDRSEAEWRKIIGSCANGRRNATFRQALARYKQKMGSWPDASWQYASVPAGRTHLPVSELFPYIVAKRNRVDVT